ncbi:dihydrofolate reductase family protein [Sporosarcina sp. 179-K 3D1 HS]|uniref:bifunctional diaminohydroxyphosphoribosylaminopyrimidine deaminase/5-amino-6-(5-phosphoribosylamino)uracil reductase RibD n=1 Tax=Sporosarcina sp. 179-K 3D1 HS TaxID=3232169 RepID=UPI0039A1F956
MDPENYMKLALDCTRTTEGHSSPNPLVGNAALEFWPQTGTTRPCVDLFIQSGVRRVFIASIHPSSAVYGTGIGLLRDAAIEVVTGIVEEAEQLNRAFFHYINYGKPYVTLKVAVTLDGRLSTQTGDSKWIRSAASRTDVHHLCYTHVAISGDVETVLHNYPFLTTRLPHGGKNPTHFVLNRHLRTPETAQVVRDGAVQTIQLTPDSRLRKEGTVPCSQEL